MTKQSIGIQRLEIASLSLATTGDYNVIYRTRHWLTNPHSFVTIMANSGQRSSQRRHPTHSSSLTTTGT